MFPGRASEAQAREVIDRLQRNGPFDACVGRKPAISEYEPDANLGDTAQVPLLENSCSEASIRREGLPDGLLKGGQGVTAKKPDVVSPSVATLYRAVRAVLEQARAAAYRTVNVAMVWAYWQVGCLIVEHEQKGKARAAYGEAMLEALSRRLMAEFGRGFDVTNLRKMRQFYRMFEIRDAVRLESSKPKRDTLRLASAATTTRHSVCEELSWSHYRLLMQVKDPASHDVRMFDAHARPESDNPTIGLILCSKKNEAIAKYSVLSETRQIFAAKHVKVLPTEQELKREVERERRLIHARHVDEGKR